jgi:DNA-binding NarL/FixJ family response regulator
MYLTYSVLKESILWSFIMLYGSNQLRDREKTIIRLTADGLKNKEIASEIGTSEHVVKNYLRVIYDKLGVWNRVELALWYVSRTEPQQQMTLSLQP